MSEKLQFGFDVVESFDDATLRHEPQSRTPGPGWEYSLRRQRREERLFTLNTSEYRAIQNNSWPSFAPFLTYQSKRPNPKVTSAKNGYSVKGRFTIAPPTAANLYYRVVQKKVNVLLSTSLAWPELFSQICSNFSAQPCILLSSIVTHHKVAVAKEERRFSCPSPTRSASMIHPLFFRHCNAM